MVYNQLISFIIYFLSGVIISIFYDFFRSLRKSLKTSDIMTHIEDACYWIFVLLFIIFVILKTSYGEIRLYSFIAIIFGGLVYYFTISSYYIKITTKVLVFIKGMIFFIINKIHIIIGKPIYFCIINIKKLFCQKSKK